MNLNGLKIDLKNIQEQHHSISKSLVDTQRSIIPKALGRCTNLLNKDSFPAYLLTHLPVRFLYAKSRNLQNSHAAYWDCPSYMWGNIYMKSAIWCMYACGYCKSSCNEHGVAYIFLNSCFAFFYCALLSGLLGLSWMQSVKEFYKEKVNKMYKK